MAQLGSAGALGALGRRFESCRPDSNNPSHRQVSQTLFFIANTLKDETERDSAIPCITLPSGIAQNNYDIHKIILIIPMIKKTTITMKSLLASKRSKAILGIGLIAVGIGAISKKVISYPTGGCFKGNQELTLNIVINKFII